MKKTLIGGAAALAVTGGSFALGALPSGAQDGDDDSVVDELVEEGVITEEQGETLTERFAERRAGRADRAGKPFGRRGGARFGGGEGPTEILDLLGIDQATLRERLAAGESLADIAGDDLDAIVDLMVADAEERLDTAVENGRLTQEEADEKTAELEERITERLESSEGFGRGRGHRHGPADPAPDAELEESSFTNA